jgi:hypothetical protein
MGCVLILCILCQFDLQVVGGKNSLAVLESDGWLEAPEAVVQQVLQLDRLDVSELQVVGALLRWGRAQVEADGHAPTKGTRLRKKLDSCLKCIRFAQFSNSQFTEVCRGDLGWVLSGEEKFQILNCISHKKWTTMPAVLAPPVPLQPRARPSVSVRLTFLGCGTAKKVAREEKMSSCFSLKVDRKCRFVGLKFILAEHSAPVKAKMQPKSIKVTEKNFPIYVLGQSYCDSSTGDLMLHKECTFLAGVKYTVQFTFPSIPLEASYKTYIFGHGASNKKSFTNGKLTATVYGPLEGVRASELLFRMFD